MTAAAFYDLEGTLIRTNLVHALYFYAQRQQGIWQTVRKTAATVLSVPAFAALNAYDRRTFNDFYFKYYRGQSEDRIRFFAEDLFEKVLRPAIYRGAPSLLQTSRANGFRQVIITGAVDIAVRPLMQHLGVEEYAANRLEFVDGIATGRVLPPAMASAAKASWMRAYAERESISLSDSFAYTDSFSDLPMLSVVGHPTAINPDRQLRRTALQHDWPILELQ